MWRVSWELYTFLIYVDASFPLLVWWNALYWLAEQGFHLTVFSGCNMFVYLLPFLNKWHFLCGGNICCFWQLPLMDCGNFKSKEIVILKVCIGYCIPVLPVLLLPVYFGADWFMIKCYNRHMSARTFSKFQSKYLWKKYTLNGVIWTFCAAFKQYLVSDKYCSQCFSVWL